MPDMEEEEVKQYVNSEFLVDFTCEKLQTRYSVVAASLKKPCTPNEIYTFGIIHKSFL